MKTFAAISLASLALAFSTSAQAEPITDGETVEIRINLSNLDLTEQEQFDQAKQRINRAVRAACTTRSASFYRTTVTDWNCVRSATATALAQAGMKKNEKLAARTQ